MANRNCRALPEGETPVSVKAVAAAAGISIPAVWKQVATGRLPRPIYPCPRSPRWYLSEIRIALAATRALPSEAKAARRTARLAAE